MAAFAVALAVAALVVIAGLYVRAPRATRVHVGEMAPDFTLPALIDGSPATFSSLRGGPMLLLAVDTRGPGTDAYLRYLERMYRRYRARGLRMVAVCLDTDLPSARAFVARNELTFTLLADPAGATVSKLYGAPREPEAYLLDPEGRVERVFTERIDWSDPATKQALERHLGPPLPGW